MPSPPVTTASERQRRFEAVYQAHHGPVFGYVQRRTDSPDDAADVIGEVFLTAWRRLEDVPDGDESRLWLYGVARRVLANHHRGERRRSALTDRLRSDLAMAYRPPEYTGEAKRIAAVFRALPEADRELLSLSAWEGLDNGQIAVVLGCSRNAVRIRLYRARKRFAAGLDGHRSAPAPSRHSQHRDHVPNGDLA